MKGLTQKEPAHYKNAVPAIGKVARNAINIHVLDIGLNCLFGFTDGVFLKNEICRKEMRDWGEEHDWITL